MTTLIAVDGHSLNLGLQKVAQTKKSPENPRPRFRIDHACLAEFLEEECGSTGQNSLRFYTDAQTPEVGENSHLMGRITKYFPAKGYGFISATDGKNYFFHNKELLNKRALCNSNEDRYPHPTSHEFQNRILNKIVTFNSTLNEDGRDKAEEVKLEFGSRALDDFYRLRREPFLEMLEDSGYQIVRCRPSPATGKAKSVDCRIYMDALCDLDAEDHFILLSDDAVFIDLVEKLFSYDVRVTLVTFDTARSEELRNVVSREGEVILLNNHLDNLELAFENDDNDDDTDDDLENTEDREDAESIDDRAVLLATQGHSV